MSIEAKISKAALEISVLKKHASLQINAKIINIYIHIINIRKYRHICVQICSEDDFIQWGMGFSACHSKNKFYKSVIGKKNSQNREDS